MLPAPSQFGVARAETAPFQAGSAIGSGIVGFD